MRQPRMTTRRWMAIVLAAALISGAAVAGLRIGRLHAAFVATAQRHTTMERSRAAQEAMERKSIESWIRVTMNMLIFAERRGVDSQVNKEDTRLRLESFRQSLALARRRTAYHAAMARKYRRAARYPWLPVAPDPPEPE